MSTRIPNDLGTVGLLLSFGLAAAVAILARLWGW